MPACSRFRASFPSLVFVPFMWLCTEECLAASRSVLRTWHMLVSGGNIRSLQAPGCLLHASFPCPLRSFCGLCLHWTCITDASACSLAGCSVGPGYFQEFVKVTGGTVQGSQWLGGRAGWGPELLPSPSATSCLEMFPLLVRSHLFSAPYKESSTVHGGGAV